MVESPPGGGLAGGSLCQGARHSWPLIWATHAYSLNPLPLPILAGGWGARLFSGQSDWEKGSYQQGQLPGQARVCLT